MSKVKSNSIRLDINIDQNNDILEVVADYNLSETMSEDQQAYYLNVVNGIISKCKSEIDIFAKEGYFIRELNKLRNFADEVISNVDEDDDEAFSIEFEPSEELLDAVSEKQNGQVKNL